MTKPVCLILGAGAGIGGNVAKRFAREGYHACLARRSNGALRPAMDSPLATSSATALTATGTTDVQANPPASLHASHHAITNR